MPIIEIKKYLKKITKQEASEHPEFENTVRLLCSMDDKQLENIIQLVSFFLLTEIREGIKGEIDYNDAPFFALVDKEYEKLNTTGCYFCDPNVDMNATPFTGKECLCLTCKAKLDHVIKFIMEKEYAHGNVSRQN
jgi:hypothetical protein